MIVDAGLKYDRRTQIGVNLGANSEVYIIDEKQLGGVMVVKEMDVARFTSPVEYFEEAKRAFEASHPNVVPIQYACIAPASPPEPEKVCLIMPYYAKGPLTHRIANGPVREREVVRVGIGILAGLAHIHSRNIIHYDVKPSNVLFDDTDEPRVADFGQALRMSPLGTTNVPALYADAYPPEAYSLAEGSAQTDIYHAGLVLYRAVNGEPHYRPQVPTDPAEHQRKTVKGKFPDRKLFMPHVSKRMRRIVRKALSIDPADRYQTATDMSVDLAGIKLIADWDVTLDPSGTTWRLARDAQPDLVVRLEKGPSGCHVDVYTHGTTRRARNPGTFAVRGLSETAAMKHLNEVVFPALP